VSLYQFLLQIIADLQEGKSVSIIQNEAKLTRPRVGLAYSIDPKTVVRSGYGISYTFFNRPGSAATGICVLAG